MLLSIITALNFVPVTVQKSDDGIRGTSIFVAQEKLRFIERALSLGGCDCVVENSSYVTVS